jgi:hypothetical protein
MSNKRRRKQLKRLQKKLMEQTSRKSSFWHLPKVSERPPKALLYFLLILGVSYVVYLWAMPRGLEESGVLTVAMDQLRRCPDARNLLGDNIEAEPWFSRGHVEVPTHKVSGGRGGFSTKYLWNASPAKVDWALPVEGSRESGMFHLKGERARFSEVWELHGILEVDDVRISTRDCKRLP